jgi:hypothetical protein
VKIAVVQQNGPHSEIKGRRSVEKISCLYLIEISWVFGILDFTVASPSSTQGTPMILHVLIAMVAGWINRHQQQVVSYLQEEKRILKAKLGNQRIRFTDTERRRSTWGYSRIQGALANLGHHIDKITVRNVLCRHHIDPAPKRRESGLSWSTLLKLYGEVIAATDFFTVEVTFWQGLVTYDHREMA